MSNTSNRRAERRRSHRTHWLIGAGSTALLIGVIGLAAWASQGGASDEQSHPTRATNSMGMPILEQTPGSAEGVAVTPDATATPQQWALGQVPLNVAVLPRWEIANTGGDTIALGEPHVQINQGCCPGALTYDGATELAPAQTVGLTFELSMHPGMDGAHDMTIHVPVRHADGTETTLDLSVTGDFRD